MDTRAIESYITSDIIIQVKKLLNASKINGYMNCGHDVHKKYRDSIEDVF